MGFLNVSKSSSTLFQSSTYDQEPESIQMYQDDIFIKFFYLPLRVLHLETTS